MIIERGYQVSSGDRLGEILGFDEQLFDGWFDIYPDGRLYLHYINSLREGRGHTQRLLDLWEGAGWDIYVVRPNDTMKHILNKRGYICCFLDIMGYRDESEVMYKPKK